MHSWQQTIAKEVRFDVDYDFTLVQDNASICFSTTSNETYMMWAINTFDVAQPVVRRHVYNNGNLTYSDTPITAFTKADLIGKQHHVRLECETPRVRTYIDNVLVDTYEDTQGVLAVGDLGMRVSATGNEREKAYFDNIKQTVYDLTTDNGQATLDGRRKSQRTTDGAVFDLCGREIVNSKLSNGKWQKGVVITSGKKIIR